MSKRNKIEKWRDSRAKDLLRGDILSGDVQPYMKPREVWQMRPEYRDFDPRNFATNLRNLRNHIVHNNLVDILRQKLHSLVRFNAIILKITVIC